MPRNVPWMGRVTTPPSGSTRLTWEAVSLPASSKSLVVTQVSPVRSLIATERVLPGTGRGVKIIGPAPAAPVLPPLELVAAPVLPPLLAAPELPEVLPAELETPDVVVAAPVVEV